MSTKHTPGPWFTSRPHGTIYIESRMAGGLLQEVAAVGPTEEGWDQQTANGRLIAAAPDLLEACKNAIDILMTDRQAFVDCNQLRDCRTDDPIANGLVFVQKDAWITPDDAEALRDYDRAIEQLTAAIAKATGSTT